MPEGHSAGALAQPSSIVQQPPAALQQALTRPEDLAARKGVSRFTVANVKKGQPGASAPPIRERCGPSACWR